MNIIFHASAGTGKTYQVTNLYVSLLLGRDYAAATADGKTRKLHAADGPADPRRVLLMTFTDNAAAELRTRVTGLILKARHEAEEAGDGAGVERAVAVLRQLPAAPICTIHSFCAGLLREHALEAGLSPSFSVLDPSEAGEILETVARDALLSRLRREPAEDGTAFDADLAAFCTGKQQVLGGGEYGLSVVDAAVGLLHQAASKGIGLADAESLLPKPELTVTIRDFEGVLEDLKKARAERGGKLTPTAAAVFQTLEKNLRDVPTLGKTGAPLHNDAGRGAACRSPRRSETAATGADCSGDLRSPKHEEPGDMEAFAKALKDEGVSFGGKGLGDIAARLKGLVERAMAEAGYRRHHAAIRAFARYAGAVAAAYAERKARLGVLDFDDLLLRARDLLKARRDAAGLFDYLIVDEVQDTSRVQCEIIEELWDPERNRLVICGDTKQSIYAWRNADPRVMPDLERAIEKAKPFARVALRASYRSKDAVLEVVNRVFREVYGEAYTKDEELVPAREEDAAVLRKGEKPCVEFLMAPWERGSSKFQVPGSKLEEADVPEMAERVRAEMEAVARRIRLLVEGGDEWRPAFRHNGATGTFEKTGAGNAFRYSDILVLLRRKTNQQVLEHMLREHGIPYRVGGQGCGLFSRQEVKDALLFFKTITHPFDTISLVGFLRSPWAGLSDETIIQLGWDGRRFDEALLRRCVTADGPQRPHFQKCGRSSDEELARLDEAGRLISAFRGEADFRLASDLLRDLIARTGYDAVVAGSYRGAQRLANLKKLIDWLRQTERGGTVLLADVVKALEERVDSPPDIPEAVLLDPDENAVTVMTIHGAKGLTARVVFVPELNAQPRGGAPWATLAGEPAEGCLLHVKTEDVARRASATPGFDEAAEEAGRVRAAESKNLFYVALTRARDLVVLSGAAGRQRPGEWRAPMDTLRADASAAALVRTLSYDDVAAAGAPASGAEEARRTPGPELFDGATARYPKPLAIPAVLRFPATMLSAFHSDPAEFVRSRLAEIEPPWLRARRRPDDPEPAGEAAPAVADTEDYGRYARIGTAGHEALEQFALGGWRGDLAALARAAAEANDLDEADARELSARLETVRAEIVAAAAKAAGARVEWPFALALKGSAQTLIVDGTMDLLLRRADGACRIVDYKFTDERPAELLTKYSLQLNLYREALRAGPDGSRGEVSLSLLAIGRDAARWVDVPPDPKCAERAIAAAVELDRLMRPQPLTPPSSGGRGSPRAAPSP